MGVVVPVLALAVFRSFIDQRKFWEFLQQLLFFCIKNNINDQRAKKVLFNHLDCKGRALFVKFVKKDFGATPLQNVSIFLCNTIAKLGGEENNVKEVINCYLKELVPFGEPRPHGLWKRFVKTVFPKRKSNDMRLYLMTDKTELEIQQEAEKAEYEMLQEGAEDEDEDIDYYFYGADEIIYNAATDTVATPKPKSCLGEHCCGGSERFLTEVNHNHLFIKMLHLAINF